MNTLNLAMILGSIASLIGGVLAIFFAGKKSAKAEAKAEVLERRVEAMEIAKQVETDVQSADPNELRERLKSR